MSLHYSISLRGILVFCLLGMVCSVLAEEASLDAPRKWKLIRDKNHIQVFKAHRPNSRLKTFRGISTMPIQNPMAVYEVFNDYEGLTTWMQYIDKVEDIERVSEVYRHLRVEIGLPWPLADRVAFITGAIRQIDDRTMDVKLVANPELQGDDSGFIRIPELSGHLRFHFPTPHLVTVEYQIILDPGGYIPDFLANIVLQDAPYFSLVRLPKVLQKPRYQIAENEYIHFHFDEVADIEEP